MPPVWHSCSSVSHPHGQSHSGDRVSQCRGKQPPNAAESQRTMQPPVLERGSVRVRLAVSAEREARFSPVAVAEPSAAYPCRSVAAGRERTEPLLSLLRGFLPTACRLAQQAL
eukprot:1864-Pleurochrysis_carterae.AAC.1